jgi:membrane protein YqaA with SNARE-associated domain
MTSLYTTMYKFLDAGMMDPVLLGLIVGCGITIGDSLFYYLGVTGRKLFTGKAKQWSDWLVEMINRQKGWQVQTLILIYTGFTPLPNDILSVSLAVARFRYRKVFIPLLIGNIIQMILIGIGVVYGIDYLQEILA